MTSYYRYSQTTVRGAMQPAQGACLSALGGPAMGQSSPCEWGPRILLKMDR